MVKERVDKTKQLSQIELCYAFETSDVQDARAFLITNGIEFTEKHIDEKDITGTFKSQGNTYINYHGAPFGIALHPFFNCVLWTKGGGNMRVVNFAGFQEFARLVAKGKYDL